ncbi:MAG: N-acetyltransferase [Proteobacteria bacterium]|nr:N-acetyltransferase [Pseudomonadota bacterium]
MCRPHSSSATEPARLIRVSVASIVPRRRTLPTPVAEPAQAVSLRPKVPTFQGFRGVVHIIGPAPGRLRAGLGREARGLPHLVATDGALVLGYAYAGPFRARSAYRFSVEDSVYIAPEAIRRGVGRRLLGAVIVACEAAGYRQMVAVIGDSGHEASIGLHAALGFEPAGLLRAIGFKFGRWVDSVMMQRALGLGDATLPVEPPRP